MVSCCLGRGWFVCLKVQVTCDRPVIWGGLLQTPCVLSDTLTAGRTGHDLIKRDLHPTLRVIVILTLITLNSITQVLNCRRGRGGGG